MKKRLNQNKPSFLTALIMGLLTVGTLAQASSYFVQDTVVVGAPKEETTVITELVKSNVSQMGGQNLASSQKDADFTLQPRLIKLGSAYMITVDKVKQGKVVYSAQGKAGQLEDMDNVTQRVTRAAVTEVEMKQDTRVGEVTDRETTEGNKRKETVKHWYFGIGPAASNINSDSMFNLNISYAWDMNSAALKIFWDMDFGQNSSYSALGIGGNYFFSDRATTPFLGGKVGYGTAVRRYPDDGTTFFGNTSSASGWVLGAEAGYQFFRTSSVNLEIALHYSFLMPVTVSASGITKNPGIYGARLGLYF